MAQGGMGEVWKGYDIQLGRPVAIKALRGDLGVTQEAKLLRLRAEAHNSALGAMAPRGKKSYSKDRYFQADVTSNDKVVPEGPLDSISNCNLAKSKQASFFVLKPLRVVRLSFPVMGSLPM